MTLVLVPSISGEFRPHQPPAPLTELWQGTKFTKYKEHKSYSTGTKTNFDRKMKDLETHYILNKITEN